VTVRIAARGQKALPQRRPRRLQKETPRSWCVSCQPSWRWRHFVVTHRVEGLSDRERTKLLMLHTQRTVQRNTVGRLAQSGCPLKPRGPRNEFEVLDQTLYDEQECQGNNREVIPSRPEGGMATNKAPNDARIPPRIKATGNRNGPRAGGRKTARRIDHRQTGPR